MTSTHKAIQKKLEFTKPLKYGDINLRVRAQSQLYQ